MRQYIKDYSRGMDMIFTIYRNKDLDKGEMLTIKLDQCELSKDEIETFYEEYDRLCEIYDDIEDHFVINTKLNTVTFDEDLDCYITSHQNAVEMSAGEVKFQKLLSEALWENGFSKDFSFNRLFIREDGELAFDITYFAGKPEYYWHSDEREMTYMRKGKKLNLSFKDLANKENLKTADRDLAKFYTFMYNFWKKHEDILNWCPDRNRQDELNRGKEL